MKPIYFVNLNSAAKLLHRLIPVQMNIEDINHQIRALLKELVHEKVSGTAQTAYISSEKIIINKKSPAVALEKIELNKNDNSNFKIV